MENKKIDKICVMVEIDGQVCHVNLADNVKRLLPGIISGLPPGEGGLQVTKLSKDFKFESLEESDIDLT